MKTVTPTRDEIRARALELFMQDMMKAGLIDVPTPEDYELKEANYWLRAQQELMTSPEAKAKDETLEFLERSASELEEVVVKSEDLKELIEASRELESVEAKLRDLREKRKKEQEQAKIHAAELEAKLEEARAEAKKRPTLKIRILKDFTEGILKYQQGSIIETPDSEWALKKIDEGYVERVEVGVPVEPTRPVAPKQLSAEEMKRLEDEFKLILVRDLGRVPPKAMMEFTVEAAVIRFSPYEEALKQFQRLANRIVSEELPPPRVRLPRRIVRIVPEERLREVPSLPPIELPKSPLSPENLFPRRPTSIETQLLFEVFRRRLADLGIDPAPHHSTFVWRFDWPFKSWEDILKEFNQLIEDIRLGRVKVRAPIIPWRTKEEAIKHFFAINLYPNVDAIVEALLEYQVVTDRDEVIKTVIESWKAKDDTRTALLTKEQIADRLGIDIKSFS